MSDQKVCPTCGTEYPLSERFCPRDGTALRSANAQGDLLGSVIAERYHILKKLGEGGMGTVYLAEHVKMGRKAALKVMNPGMNSDPDAIARFNREAANASRLNHPNVCGIYDFGETPDGLIYLAMEFIEGESLTSLIEKNGNLAAPRAASIIHQAADALAVAHDYGIVHRDLKPDNIMIAKGRDGSDLVKVVDFGIAKASSSDAQKVTKTGLVVGTPEYMSPEQLAGDKLDGRSDIYSLGLVAFNCLTGLLPFPSTSAQEAMIMRLTDQPKTLAEMKPDIEWPVELQAVMDKVLARDANERYQKSAEFGRDIAKAVENMPAAVAAAAGTMVIGAPADLPKTRMAPKAGATAKIEAPGATVAVPAAAPAKKSPMMMIVAGAVVIAGIGGAAIFMKGSGSAPPVKASDSPAQSTTAPVVTPPDTKAAAPNVTPTQKDQVKPLSKELSKGPATNPAPARDVPSGPSPADVVATWTRVVNGNPSAADASSAISAIDGVLPKLSGADRSKALYIQMVAYVRLDDDTNVCRVGKSLLALNPTDDIKEGVEGAERGRNCK
ncbi:MAG TPA: protein kinase [Gemmatimonadaceae bacterium]